jgi:hypothetical protein
MAKEGFWSWFSDNREALERFISKEPRDYAIYETLTEKLRQYSDLLIPEITMNRSGGFVLIISCDGISRGIPYVESLVDGMPDFPNWEIRKFRQSGPMELIPVNGLILKRNSIFLEWEQRADLKYDVIFFVENYDKYNKNYDIGIFLHLDHTIGEYFSMTKIGKVELRKLGFFQSKKKLKTLDDLKEDIYKELN